MTADAARKGRHPPGDEGAGGTECSVCGAPGVVYVRDSLFCATCALEIHLALLEWREPSPPSC